MYLWRIKLLKYNLIKQGQIIHQSLQLRELVTKMAIILQIFYVPTLNYFKHVLGRYYNYI